MSKKKDIWDQVTKSLASRLSKSEFKTWFYQTRLEKFDPELAIIKVPNKFVATWLTDHYLLDLKKAFKRFLKKSPSIHFSYNHPSSEKKGALSSLLRGSEAHFTQRLDPSMTFARFVTGDFNRFACSSALQVAETGAEQYNPLYVYCGTGLGKTHLLNAIGNRRLSGDRECRVRYLSSDSFSSDFIYSIQNEKLQEFREEYSSLDLLLFDDIQSLAKREKTQDEFLSIFDSLYGAKKQIVVTADEAPNKLKSLNPQLRSRLGGGLVTEIQLPDQETKINIITRKAEEDNIVIPEDVIFFLANSNTDIKGLMKNLVRLETYTSVNNGEISISMVKSLLTTKSRAEEVSVDDIKATTAAYFNISVNDLVSAKRERIYSYPRQLAMYLARKHTSLSYLDIGHAFGSRDHSTAIYAIKRINRQKDQDKQTDEDMDKINTLLG
ncbi:MAG: chromosomal replication initiator protein DnaA [Pseudomonadota bacterium]